MAAPPRSHPVAELVTKVLGLLKPFVFYNWLTVASKIG